MKVLRAQIQQMKVSVVLFTIPVVHAHVYNKVFVSLLVCNYALLIPLNLSWYTCATTQEELDRLRRQSISRIPLSQDDFNPVRSSFDSWGDANKFFGSPQVSNRKVPWLRAFNCSDFFSKIGCSYLVVDILVIIVLTL